MKKFIPWLVPMIVLLAAVPVLLIYKTDLPAKIAGVVLVVLVSVAVRVWLYNAGKLKKGKGRVRVTVNERYTLKELYPGYDRLPAQDRKGLEERMGLLLAELSFDRTDRSDASREECLAAVLTIALLSMKETYRSASGKVVVFGESTQSELVFQDQKPVLFVSEIDLKAFLKQFNPLSNTPPATGFPQETVQKFCQH